MKEQKLFMLVSLTMVLFVGSAGASVLSFDDIDDENWVGDGSNEAALVIDWKGGPEPEWKVWGYKWDDGSPTAEDMLVDVVQDDSNLYLHYDTNTFDFGSVIYGIGYHLSSTGDFEVDPTLDFDEFGIVDSADYDDDRVSVDSGDHWEEGWDDWPATWGYWLGGEEDSPVWESAQVGMSDSELTDNFWHGFSFGGEAPIPEPGTFIMLILGGLALLGRRRRL